MKVEAKPRGKKPTRPCAEDEEDLRRKAALFDYPFTY
jgi:hypothetical protein